MSCQHFTERCVATNITFAEQEALVMACSLSDEASPRLDWKRIDCGDVRTERTCESSVYFERIFAHGLSEARKAKRLRRDCARKRTRLGSEPAVGERLRHAGA